jgi:uncharacterized repeat protein (TIGR03803 family)
VFKLDTTGHETVLYKFCSVANCADGNYPAAGLVQDPAGNLFGTAEFGGANGISNSGGTIFEVDNAGHYTVLYSFCSAANCTDGEQPQAGLILDAAGNLYGTTAAGGSSSPPICNLGTCGTVFELKASSGIALGGTAVTVAPGATTGNTSTITLTPTGGFTGSVTLTAAITSSPAGAQDLPTFSFGSTSPVSITSTTAGTATLTISTTAASSASLALPAHPRISWYAASGAGLAFGLVFFPGISLRRRSWRTRLGLLAPLAILASTFVACGGSGSGGGGGGGGNPGTTPGTYTVTVTGTSGSTTATGTVTLTVQ